MQSGQEPHAPLAQDIARFREAMEQSVAAPLNTEHVIRSARDVDIAHQVNIDPQNQGIGDQILKTCSSTARIVEMQEATINCTGQIPAKRIGNIWRRSKDYAWKGFPGVGRNWV